MIVIKKIFIICTLLAVYPLAVFANQEYVSADPDSNPPASANATATATANTANSQATKAAPNATTTDSNAIAAVDANTNVNASVASTNAASANAENTNALNANNANVSNANIANTNTWNSNPAYSNNVYNSNNAYTRQRQLTQQPLVQIPPMQRPAAPMPPMPQPAAPMPPMPQPAAHMPPMPPLKPITNTNRITPSPVPVQHALPQTNAAISTVGNGYTDAQKQAWFNSCVPAVSDKRVSSFAQEFCGCGWQHISSGELSPGLLTSVIPQDANNRGVILRTISQKCMVEIMANHKLG